MFNTQGEQHKNIVLKLIFYSCKKQTIATSVFIEN